MITKRQAQVFSVYTGIAFCKFTYIHEYIEELLDRPVYTHELANEELWDTLKELAKEEFLEWSEVEEELSDELLSQLTPLEREFLVSWKELHESKEFKRDLLISKTLRGSK